MTARSTLFDEPFYLEINEARWKMAEAILRDVRRQLPLRTCLDVGSGPGWFAERLRDTGFQVQGLEGRRENVELACARVSGVRFHHVDVESEAETRALGIFDLIFCFGLLYHTENPFRVLRNLHRLTGHVLLLETMVIPGDGAQAMLISENANETQGLTLTSLIPTRPCLLKMLECSGFRHVYEYVGTVHHPDFQETEARHRRRRVFIAAVAELRVDGATRVKPVTAPKFDFAKGGERT
jgi:SAM-dependent methyltransferase